MILAISGSLRRASINSAVLRAAAKVAARDGTLVDIDESLRRLPHFDPDLEAAPPDPVRRFRTRCEDAAGLVLAVPEYAFGIPGSFKNALDWTVGSGSLYRKPVTVLGAAPPGRGGRVRGALDLVLEAHGADVVHCAVPVRQGDRDARGEITDPDLLDRLRAAVAELTIRAGTAAAQPRLSPR